MGKLPVSGAAASGRPATGDIDDLPRALRAGTRTETLRDDRLCRALAWWQGLERAAGCALPDRARIDPIVIRDLLPYCLLWDVTFKRPGRPHYACRLAGTILCEMFGREQRGMTPEQMYGPEAAGMQAEFDVAILHARPFHAAHRMAWAERPFYRYHRLLLPFTNCTPLAEPDEDEAPPALLMSVISFVPE
jgi:hypothetical protein